MEWTRLGPGIRPKVRDAFVEVRSYLYPPQGEVYYVSKRGASGDGKSWEDSFLTVTEGLAALSDNDTLFIGPGNYDEAAKMTLSSVDNVRILGMNTGMSWGEGATCIRNVIASTADILDISHCQSVEIAGISFIVISGNDCINITGLSRSLHIHDCTFIGDVGGGAVGLYGVNLDGSNGPDAMIHDCRFFRFVTASLVMGNQRNIVKDNEFWVVDSGAGILFDGASAAGYQVIKDNEFVGEGGTAGYGIYSVASTAGNYLITRNIFANFVASAEITVGASLADENTVENLADSTQGAVEQVDPEA